MLLIVRSYAMEILNTCMCDWACVVGLLSRLLVVRFAVCVLCGWSENGRGTM